VVAGDEQWREGTSNIDVPAASPTGLTVEGGKESEAATLVSRLAGPYKSTRMDAVVYGNRGGWSEGDFG
jgi:hypothetical protein